MKAATKLVYLLIVKVT